MLIKYYDTTRFYVFVAYSCGTHPADAAEAVGPSQCRRDIISEASTHDEPGFAVMDCLSTTSHVFLTYVAYVGKLISTCRLCCCIVFTVITVCCLSVLSL